MTKKILYWIDANLLGYCLSYYLQNQLDHESYALIDITDKPKKFFQEQKLVNYNKTWFYHDSVLPDKEEVDLNYLSSFEKKFNIDLWSLIINDRTFYRFNRIYKFSNDEILSILYKECKLFESIFNEIDVDFFITEEPAFRYHEFFYQLCLRKKIKVLMINPPNIKKCVISEKTRKLDSFDTLDNIQISNLNFEQLRDKLKSLSVYKQLETYRKKYKTSKKLRLNSAFDYLFKSQNTNVNTHYTYFGRTKTKVLLDAIKVSLKLKYRQRFIDKNFAKELVKNEKFIYFPLAVDEERNILINAPYYTNQIEIIRQIVKSLPIDYKLYVKEAPSQAVRYWRPISEYKEIMNIPNTRLFHPNMPSETFFKDCSLVMVISGSSGYEAAFHGKPSIIFSETGYSILPSVTQIQSILDLPSSIKKSLKTQVNPNDVEKYITYLEKNSFDFDGFQYATNYQHQFYYGGNLVDVDISVSKMELFLKNNQLLFKNAIEEYVKKINS